MTEPVLPWIRKHINRVLLLATVLKRALFVKEHISPLLWLATIDLHLLGWLLRSQLRILRLQIALLWLIALITTAGWLPS